MLDLSEHFRGLPETEVALKLAMFNVERYLRGTDVKNLRFGELIDRLRVLEQQRDAIYFGAGSR